MPRDIIPYNVSRDKEGAKSNIDLPDLQSMGVK